MKNEKRSRRPDTEIPAGQLPEILREIDDSVILLAEILGTPEPERRALLENGVRYRSLQLCQLLETRSREAWFDDPARSVELAELAVAVAERLDDDHYGTLLAEDARASAWAHLGNAYRVASRHGHAEEALRIAESHYQRSGEDAYTEAQILSFKASLRSAQGKYDDAAHLLDGAITIYREARDRYEEGRALILKGTVLGYAGRYQEAVRLIRKGQSKTDLFKEPRLLVAARHNLIWFLNESGHPGEAQESLTETRRLYQDLGERMNLVRLRWLEGKIARGLGHPDEAAAALKDARDAFLENGIGIDAALVSLDLAVVYMQRGETGAIKQLAAELVPIFEAGAVHPQAYAAFLLFRQAAEAEQVTRALLDELAVKLQQTNGLAKLSEQLGTFDDVMPLEELLRLRKTD
jgi:tetratricopeptide (TPR) repeat protein